MSEIAVPPKKDGRGGRRAGAGKPRGSRNKKTLERQAAIAAQIDRIKDGGGQTGKETLEKLMAVAQDCMISERRDLGKENVPNQEDHWKRFGEWFDRTAYCAKELAKYQSPTFKAVAVMAPAPTDPMTKTVEGKVATLPGAEDAADVYQKLIGGRAA
jgi:hypothetical protein